MKVSIPDMSCGHCRAVVEKVVAGLGGTAAVDLESRSIEVTGLSDADALLAALKAEGYPAQVLDG